MGTNLHRLVIEFFETRMESHSKVARFRRLDVDDEVVYEVERHDFGDVVRIWLSDQYHFGEGDYLARPKEIRRGDYILIARPEASFSIGSDPDAQIGIGRIRHLMGALNVPQMWRYEPTSRNVRRLYRG